MHLGQVHQQVGRTEQALEYYENAMQVERQRESPNKVSLGRILNLIGNVYLQLGATTDMMKYYEEASRIFEANQEEGETLIVSGYNFYGLSKTNPLCVPVA